MWGRSVDVIAHARFQVNHSGVSEPQVAENDHPPVNWHIALTTVYALTCYTVICLAKMG